MIIFNKCDRTIFLNINANSQTNNNLNFNYIQQHIESKLLKDSEKLEISLPGDYANSKEIKSTI
tara:strand:+ start:1119 stop:1310 length:192 start_codon:yes stop_codon:yes gene_type:complete